MVFLIDFDGTLAVGDTVDRLLAEHADPAWEALEADWMANRISALQCMKSQIELVRADALTLTRFFRSIVLDHHFRAFWEFVRTRAVVAVVSDGLDQAVHAALEGNGGGLAGLPVFANRLEMLPGNRCSLSFPHREENCAGGNGVCKCAVSRSLSLKHAGPVVLVGDGKSDACVAAQADIVFAKDWLAGHCEARGIPHFRFGDFSDVLQAVRRWPGMQSISAA